MQFMKSPYSNDFDIILIGVTATMLIMSLIGVLTPTLFYQIHGGVNTLDLLASNMWMVKLELESRD